MIKSRVVLNIFLVFLTIFLVSALLKTDISYGQTEAITYTIADTTGDWGYPSPYTHYCRGPGYVRMSFIFDTLVWKDETGFVPLLAKKWHYEEEENAYIFSLRKGVSWHDGREFTVKDVVFTFSYIKKHPTWMIDPSLVEKAVEIDPYTVKIELKEPYAPFLNNVACTLPILPQHIWQEVEDPINFQKDEALVGTGPYRLLDYNRAQGTYLYQAYPNYYLGKPKVDRIKFVKVSEQTAPAALRREKVNASSVPPEAVKDLKKEGLQILTCSGSWNAKLMINHTKEPLSSKKFRQALAFAINREEIVKITQRGYATVGSPGLIPPSQKYWYNPNIEQYSYSPTKTQAILESLGYNKKNEYYWKNGKKLTLELLTSPQFAGFTRLAELISQQLEKVGITIRMRILDSKSLDIRVKGWKFDLAVSGHGGLSGDPSILNKVILGKSFISARYNENELLSKLLIDQLHQMDRGKRKEIIYKIQKIYAQELPALTLYYPTWYWTHDGSSNLYYTQDGIAFGIPLPLNKLCFLG
jgi:peptide/nickel transport system substrate-binding protein